jgi:hypothetical protein
MSKVVDKTVTLTLIGIDGNAFYLMVAFSKAAKQQGWSADEISKVITEAMSGDYNHLLATLVDHCDDEDWDEVRSI